MGSGGNGGLLYAEILCSPDVATVEVRRSGGIRTAHIGDGPGVIIVSWRDGKQAEVVAFDAAGREIASLIPQHRNPHRPRRPDEGMG